MCGRERSPLRSLWCGLRPPVPVSRSLSLRYCPSFLLPLGTGDELAVMQLRRVPGSARQLGAGQALRLPEGSSGSCLRHGPGHVRAKLVQYVAGYSTGVSARSRDHVPVACSIGGRRPLNDRSPRVTGQSPRPNRIKLYGAGKYNNWRETGDVRTRERELVRVGNRAHALIVCLA